MQTPIESRLQLYPFVSNPWNPFGPKVFHEFIITPRCFPPFSPPPPPPVFSSEISSTTEGRERLYAKRTLQTPRGAHEEGPGRLIRPGAKREKQENEEETVHAGPTRAFPFVSLNFRTVSDRLRRREKKGRGWVSREPFLFFPALRWWRLSQHNSREPQTVFALVSVGCLTLFLTLSHIIRENLEIYSVPFPFFFFVWFQRWRFCTFVLLFPYPLWFRIKYLWFVKFSIQKLQQLDIRFLYVNSLALNVSNLC